MSLQTVCQTTPQKISCTSTLYIAKIWIQEREGSDGNVEHIYDASTLLILDGVLFCVYIHSNREVII